MGGGGFKWEDLKNPSFHGLQSGSSFFPHSLLSYPLSFSVLSFLSLPSFHPLSIWPPSYRQNSTCARLGRRPAWLNLYHQVSPPNDTRWSCTRRSKFRLTSFQTPISLSSDLHFLVPLNLARDEEQGGNSFANWNLSVIRRDTIHIVTSRPFFWQNWGKSRSNSAVIHLYFPWWRF